MMGAASKSRILRWIVVTTALVGLVSAVLVAGAKYYELQKARTEAAKSDSSGPAQQAHIGFTVGSVWDGVTDPKIRLQTRITVDHVENGWFKGVMTAHQAGDEWYSLRIKGTISPEGEVEFKTRPEDRFTGERKVTPCLLKGMVRGNEFIGRWSTLDGTTGDSFVLTRR
jgi:hypothetical protein